MSPPSPKRGAEREQNRKMKGDIKLKAVEKTEEKAVVEVCPLCGSKMEKGFIGVWRGIFWSDKKRAVIWKLPFGKDMLTRSSGWAAPMLEAYRCKKCKLVTFKYGEAGNPAEGSP